jgi:hypothetical protein
MSLLLALLDVLLALPVAASAAALVDVGRFGEDFLLAFPMVKFN